VVVLTSTNKGVNPQVYLCKLENLKPKMLIWLETADTSNGKALFQEGKKVMQTGSFENKEEYKELFATNVVKQTKELSFGP